MSIYNHNFEKINGGKINISAFKGKKILLVNTASKCGYTKQYKNLQDLHLKHGDKVEIIGIPCNQFLGQEPGNDEKINTFCELNYGVSFLMSSKTKVRGANAHPLYQWIKEEAKTKNLSATPKWNFHKFLFDEEGSLIGSFGASTLPDEDEILNLILQ